MKGKLDNTYLANYQVKLYLSRIIGAAKKNLTKSLYGVFKGTSVPKGKIITISKKLVDSFQVQVISDIDTLLKALKREGYINLLLSIWLLSREKKHRRNIEV